jgi:hypothetical protein
MLHGRTEYTPILTQSRTSGTSKFCFLFAFFHASETFSFSGQWILLHVQFIFCPFISSPMQLVRLLLCAYKREVASHQTHNTRPLHILCAYHSILELLIASRVFSIPSAILHYWTGKQASIPPSLVILYGRHGIRFLWNDLARLLASSSHTSTWTLMTSSQQRLLPRNQQPLWWHSSQLGHLQYQWQCWFFFWTVRALTTYICNHASNTIYSNMFRLVDV